MKQWRAVRANAKIRKVNRFDMEGAAGIVGEMRTLAGSPHLTAKQKTVFRDITAEHDLHAARQQQRKESRQLSQGLGHGRSM